MRELRTEVGLLAARVGMLIGRTHGAGPHRSDLREIQARLLALTVATEAEADLLLLLREARDRFGSLESGDTEQFLDFVQRLDAALGRRGAEQKHCEQLQWLTVRLPAEVVEALGNEPAENAREILVEWARRAT